jgi:serine protease Do
MNEKQSGDTFWRVLSVLLLVALMGTVAVIVWQSQRPIVRNGQDTSQAKSHLAAYVPGLNGNGNNVYWIADLAEKSLPFVVNIKTEMKQDEKVTTGMDNNQGGKSLPQNIPPELRQFLEPFGQQYDNQGQQAPQNQAPSGGEGSGFVYRADGYVVTNAHVVAGADKFTVRMNGGKEYSAKLIGSDEIKDIAVLKVDAGNLPVAPLGDSDKVRIGEPVIAIGSPLGFEATVTAGIISTNHRSLSDLGQADDPRTPQTYLQTDAAINRGNSGGPLLNAAGEVIGVNRAIARWDNDGTTMIPIEGIGFAIPIDEVKNSIDQIVQHGKVVYPGISAKIASLSDYVKQNPGLKLEVDKGVYVVAVTVGGPADHAGIKAGDVILSVDGATVETGRALISIMQTHKTGERVTLRLARQGTKKQEDVTVVLGELDLRAANADNGQ